MNLKEKGHLRICGNGGVPLSEVVDYWNEVDNTYNSFYVFELLIDRIKEVKRSRESTLDLFLSHTLYSKKGDKHESKQETDILLILNYWPPTEKRIASFVPRQDRLILDSVVMQSPGWFDIFASLNPLTFLKEVLDSLHTYRQDISYRESAERERLKLENEEKKLDIERKRLENERFANESEYIREKNKLSNNVESLEFIKESIKTLTQEGIPEEIQIALIEQFIKKPVKNLEKFQDSAFLEGSDSTKLLSGSKIKRYQSIKVSVENLAKLQDSAVLEGSDSTKLISESKDKNEDRSI